MGRAFSIVLVIAISFATSGCACLRSAVNASPDVRWWLFSNFGASKMCPEILKRGLPIKLTALKPASIGRFFPHECHVAVDEARRTIVMTAAGTGYVTLPVARRVGFSVALAVEYVPDFRFESEATYVWGKYNRFVSAPDLRIIGVENPAVGLATKTPLGDVATLIANGLVTSEIGRGFTVVRKNDGDDFAVGHLEPPLEPQRQWQPGRERFLLENDLADVASGAREYLGPVEITSAGATLFVRSNVAGDPLSFTILGRGPGDVWRRTNESAFRSR